MRSIFERLECSTARNRDSFIELRNYRFGPRTQRLGASDADKRLERKTFLDNLQWSPLPEGKQLIRSTWVVGDRYNREQQVDLVCKLAQEALKDKFAPHIKNFAPGLSNYIEIVSQN